MKHTLLSSVFVVAVLVFAYSPGFGADIHEAVQADSLEQVKRLLADDSTLIDAPDQYGRTPLHWACRGVNFDIVKYLVETGANVNAADINGMVPLHNVASRGHEDAVRLLIEKGAHLDEQSAYDSGTALHYAALGGFKEVVSLLLENGARTDLQDDVERTPLQTAIVAGYTGVAELLVNQMAESNPESLNYRDFDGNTALHLAIMRPDFQSIAALVLGGADINVRNALGLTPFNLSVAYGHQDMSDLLTENGADQSPQKFPVLTGPYLGQTPPGRIPKLFAKGIVSTSRGLHANIAFSPDLKEAVWESGDALCFLKMNNNIWSAPDKLVLFKENYSVDAPFFSHDGNRVYFVAGLRDTANMMSNEMIWYIERHGSAWSEPELLDSIVNSEPIHWQASMDVKGNVYTSGIYCAYFEDGKYTTREKLPAVINVIPDSIQYAGEVAPFISPDGDYLIFNRFTPPPPGWSVEFLVSFRHKDGEWTEPKDLRNKILGGGMSARVSPDGKYLFFLSDRPGSAKERSVYWVDASVIEELRPE